MGYRKERTISEQGRRPMVGIPREWMDYHGLKKGDKVVELGDTFLIHVPKELEKKARRMLRKIEGETDE